MNLAVTFEAAVEAEAVAGVVLGAHVWVWDFTRLWSFVTHPSVVHALTQWPVRVSERAWVLLPKRSLFPFRDTDVHTVASLLKLYLRDLPEPVVPWSQYEGFLLCGQLMNADEAKVGVSS